MINWHVLLVGIDAYSRRPLYGCVNDIDAVQRLLLERVGVRREQIRRLASPHADAAHATEIAEQPATLANLREALAALARDARAGDRVFIYYSGHGARLPFERADGSRFHREAMVPVDVFDQPAQALLFDHELNQYLGEIGARTRSVALVLDCCHSAGVTRLLVPGMTARVLEPREDLGVTEPLREPAEPRGAGAARSIEDCHVVTACLNHELALEGLGDDGLRHGLLTQAFVRALAAVPDAELPAVPWSRIWQAMRGDVETRNPQQHLWMAGNARRAVLAGPPVTGDPGFGVRRSGEVYEIDAGTVASVTESTLIAVYGEQPAELPPVGSAEDRAARLGLVRVTEARVSTATAAADGAPFPVPAGARGRIVEPGKAARLRCAVVAADDPGRAAAEAVTAALAASPLLEVVAAERAQVRLEQAGARWLVTDDVHGTAPGTELLALSADELRHARAVLEHYFYYALPLRLAEAAVDLPGALRLAVLACPGELPSGTADLAELPGAPMIEGAAAYDLRDGDFVCFQVQNTSRARLRVTLVCSASSGKVQIIDEQSIDADSTYRFWLDNAVGVPFDMTLPAGKQQCIDRLIAIGTTGNQRVEHLRCDGTFAEALAGRDIGGGSRRAIERWTAAQVVLKTRAK